MSRRSGSNSREPGSMPCTYGSVSRKSGSVSRKFGSDPGGSTVTRESSGVTRESPGVCPANPGVSPVKFGSDSRKSGSVSRSYGNEPRLSVGGRSNSWRPGTVCRRVREILVNSGGPVVKVHELLAKAHHRPSTAAKRLPARGHGSIQMSQPSRGSPAPTLSRNPMLGNYSAWTVSSLWLFE